MNKYHSKYPYSANTLQQSWKEHFKVDSVVIGRGGAGKVVCVSLKYNHEQPIEMNGSSKSHSYCFGKNCEQINQPPLGKHLAMKIIRRFRAGRDSLERIRTEVKLMKQLQFSEKLPNIVRAPKTASPFIFSVYEDPVEVAIVMEYAFGGSLFDLCRKRSELREMHFLECSSVNSSASSPISLLHHGSTYSVLNETETSSALAPHDNECLFTLPETYIRKIIRKVVKALSFMHGQANIVHLDIKAENILLREPYPSTNVFISDFGLATVLNDYKPHRQLAGTPDYAAPEIISYDPISFATDMWSVGILTYFMITGVSPFLSDTKAITQSNIMQIKIDYPEDIFTKGSSTAMDFIKALIRRDQKERLSADEALQHDWLGLNKPRVSSLEKQQPLLLNLKKDLEEIIYLMPLQHASLPNPVIEPTHPLEIAVIRHTNEVSFSNGRSNSTKNVKMGQIVVNISCAFALSLSPFLLAPFPNSSLLHSLNNVFQLSNQQCGSSRIFNFRNTSSALYSRQTPPKYQYPNNFNYSRVALACLPKADDTKLREYFSRVFKSLSRNSRSNNFIKYDRYYVFNFSPCEIVHSITVSSPLCAPKSMFKEFFLSKCTDSPFLILPYFEENFSIFLHISMSSTELKAAQQNFVSISIQNFISLSRINQSFH